MGFAAKLRFKQFSFSLFLLAAYEYLTVLLPVLISIFSLLMPYNVVANCDIYLTDNLFIPAHCAA